MTTGVKDKIGKWIGNILILLCVALILYSCLNLFYNGHKQCTKPDLEKKTFWLTSISYIVILLIIVLKLSKKIDEQKERVKPNSKLKTAAEIVLGGVVLIVYILATFEIQFTIEDSVTTRVQAQLKVDGAKHIGIVENYRSIFSSGKAGKILVYDQIEFKYINNSKTINGCYSIKYGSKEKYKIGDTVNFIISKSNPEYILLDE